MDSQVCCSNKLLSAMGLKPAGIPAETLGLPALATWYADMFNFNRRKCLIFYNPSTGYGTVAAYVTKKRLASLNQELARTLQQALQDDGAPSEKAAELLAALAKPVICRTSDRKARAHVVHAIKDAEFAMWRSDMSDPAVLEREAHIIVAYGFGGPTMDPLKAFGETIGENLQRRLRYGQLDRAVCQVLVTLQGIEPRIWRRLLIPCTFKLDRVHLIIQRAFGWTNSHLHMFRAGGKAFEAIYDAQEEYEGQDESGIGFYNLLRMSAGRQAMKEC